MIWQNRIMPDTFFTILRSSALVLAGIWSVALVPNDTPQEQIEQIRQNAWRALKPLTTGAYMNFLSDAGESSVRDAYPPDTYNRLARVKALYDPANVFNQNHNIQPVPALQPE